MASHFVTSHSAMVQLQENLVHEQNLFLSLLGSIWRRVSQVLLHLHGVSRMSQVSTQVHALWAARIMLLMVYHQ